MLGWRQFLSIYDNACRTINMISAIMIAKMGKSKRNSMLGYLLGGRPPHISLAHTTHLAKLHPSSYHYTSRIYTC